MVSMFFLFLFLILLAVNVNAADELKGVFKPLTDLVSGFFGMFTENPEMWIGVLFGFLVGVIIFLVSGLIPVVRFNSAIRAVLSIAIGLAIVIIFKTSFIATILGAYFFYGLAVLMGFTLLGTIYLSRGTFKVDANSPVADVSAYTVVIAKKISLFEGPHLVLNTNYSQTDIPVPDGVKGGITNVMLSK